MKLVPIDPKFGSVTIMDKDEGTFIIKREGLIVADDVAIRLLKRHGQRIMPMKGSMTQIVKEEVSSAPTQEMIEELRSDIRLSVLKEVGESLSDYLSDLEKIQVEIEAITDIESVPDSAKHIGGTVTAMREVLLLQAESETKGKGKKSKRS